MLECITETKKVPKKVLTYILPPVIREELGDYDFIDRIKIVIFPDNNNTRSVYICTMKEEFEEIAPTPMQVSGLVTIMDGKFVMIHSDGETTLHFTNEKTEEDVINKVYKLSERKGLTKGIATYKKRLPKLKSI